MRAEWLVSEGGFCSRQGRDPGGGPALHELLNLSFFNCKTRESYHIRSLFPRSFSLLPVVSLRVVRVSRWGSGGGLLAVRYIFKLGRRET